MSKKKKKEKPTKGHYHEAADRLAVLTDTFHHHVRNHLAIDASKKYTKMAEKVEKALWDLYQEMGQHM